MRILSIDPGSTKGIGWARSRDDRVVESGVVFVPKMVPGDRTPLWAAIEQILGESNLYDLLAYEQVTHHSGVYAAHMYGGQIALIQSYCTLVARQWLPVPIARGKKALQCSASGKAKDKAMPAAARKLGYDWVTDPNEADAIGINLAAMEMIREGKPLYGTDKKST